MLNITNINNLDPFSYDECFVIMRTDKYVKPGCKHLPILSSSWDLFKTYLNLRDAGAWNRTAFKSIYVPKFLLEMHNPNAGDAFNYIWAQHYLGKNIQLGCSCTDESLCHRSIVGGLLEGVVVPVVYDTGTSYARYYKIFNGEK